jgi:hypothetical protein
LRRYDFSGLPKAVKMRGNQVPGKQWMATTGSHDLKLTIQDEADCSIEKLPTVS